MKHFTFRSGGAFASVFVSGPLITNPHFPHLPRSTVDSLQHLILFLLTLHLPCENSKKSPDGIGKLRDRELNEIAFKQLRKFHSQKF